MTQPKRSLIRARSRLPKMVERLIRVKDVRELPDSSVRVFLDMSEVMTPLSPEAHALQWAILDLDEYLANDRWDLNLPFLLEQVSGSPTGFRLSFEDLQAFAGRMVQVSDGVFVGCRNGALLPRRSDPDTSIIERADMLLAAFDSTDWIVGGPADIIDRFSARFSHIEEANPASTSLYA